MFSRCLSPLGTSPAFAFSRRNLAAMPAESWSLSGQNANQRAAEEGRKREFVLCCVFLASASVCYSTRLRFLSPIASSAGESAIGCACATLSAAHIAGCVCICCLEAIAAEGKSTERRRRRAYIFRMSKICTHAKVRERRTRAMAFEANSIGHLALLSPSHVFY